MLRLLLSLGGTVGEEGEGGSRMIGVVEWMMGCVPCRICRKSSSPLVMAYYFRVSFGVDIVCVGDADKKNFGHDNTCGAVCTRDI